MQKTSRPVLTPTYPHSTHRKARPCGGLAKLIKEKNRQMNEAVKVLDFETAALLRDEIIALEKRK